MQRSHIYLFTINYLECYSAFHKLVAQGVYPEGGGMGGDIMEIDAILRGNYAADCKRVRPTRI
jgi:hypothetical protein